MLHCSPGDTISWCDQFGCHSINNPWRPTIALFDGDGTLLATSVRGQPGPVPLGAVNCTLGTSLQNYPVGKGEVRYLWLDGYEENDYGSYTLYVGFVADPLV